MYDNAVEEWTTDEGYRVRIMQDMDSYNCDPRGWDNLGIMACWHGRYSLGDEQPTISPSEYLADLPDGTVILPLYLYDHSGITMSTSKFSCPWDSGQVGFIYATPDTIDKEGPTDKSDERVREILAGEVETYDLYLRGEVYYYVVDKPVTCDHGDTHYEDVDACAGYLGYEDTLAEVRSQWPEVVPA